MSLKGVLLAARAQANAQVFVQYAAEDKNINNPKNDLSIMGKSLLAQRFVFEGPEAAKMVKEIRSKWGRSPTTIRAILDELFKRAGSREPIGSIELSLGAAKELNRLAAEYPGAPRFTENIRKLPWLDRTIRAGADKK